MRSLGSLALVAALAGCGSKSKAEAPAGCDLAGLYRLRFDAGVGQWLWFRFRIAPNGMTATLEKPTAFAQGKDGYALKLDPEPAACKASVIATSARGDLVANVTLDPRTNLVTGKLRYAGARDGVELDGVRDTGAVPSGPNACIKPGMYRLVVPAEQAWESEGDKADCDDAELDLPFLVEPFGNNILVDEIDSDGTASWSAEDTWVDGPCSAQIQFRHREHTVRAEVTFSGDEITAKGNHASVQVVTNRGDVVRCTLAKPMIWIERAPS